MNVKWESLASNKVHVLDVKPGQWFIDGMADWGDESELQLRTSDGCCYIESGETMKNKDIEGEKCIVVNVKITVENI